MEVRLFRIFCPHSQSLELATFYLITLLNFSSEDDVEIHVKFEIKIVAGVLAIILGQTVLVCV